MDARGSATLALDMTAGMLELERVTVFGALNAHRLYASEALVTGHVEVTDNQAGCFRFSAAPAGSRLPRPYRSHVLKRVRGPLRLARVRQPGLRPPRGRGAGRASPRRRERLRDGRVQRAHATPSSSTALRTKVDEYLPFGLIPLFIKET